MKAVVYNEYGPPEVLRIKDIAIPEPEEDELLIKIFVTTATSGDANLRGFTFVPPGFGPVPRLMNGSPLEKALAEPDGSPKKGGAVQLAVRRLPEADFARIVNFGLPQDLEQRGKIDLEECFIDGSFSVAKKGAMKSAKPSAARAVRSWQLQTALVFLSPYGRQVLRRMKPAFSSD